MDFFLRKEGTGWLLEEVRKENGVKMMVGGELGFVRGSGYGLSIKIK
jgi:hypothetical protein